MEEDSIYICDCPDCDGEGEEDGEECFRCNGTGEIEDEPARDFAELD